MLPRARQFAFFSLIFPLFFSLLFVLSCKKEKTSLAKEYEKLVPNYSISSIEKKKSVKPLPMPMPTENGKYSFSLFKEGMNVDEFASLLVESMDDYEVIGQLFMFTYLGREADSEIINWISKYKIGSVKIFGWNGIETAEICSSVTKMQKAALETELAIPLLVATDQEGGWVRHVKANTSVTQGNMSIGASGLIKDAYLSSYYISSQLAALGINMNFAPTVDLFIEQESKIIGTRSFSADPNLCANLAKAFYLGHKANGVIATAKHFPGHGNSKEDSHGALPIIDSDIEFLEKNDLVPYHLLIKEKIPSIMVGHISFPKITQNYEPATLSHTIITKLLKEKLAYGGIVITDDLNMAGMTKDGISSSKKSLNAILAGNDIVLISKVPDNLPQYQVQWQQVLNEYQQNEEFKKLAKESAKRVIKVKLEYLSSSSAVTFFPNATEAAEKIASDGSEQYFFNQALRSITQLSENPINIEADEKVLLAGASQNFFTQGKAIFTNSSNLNLYSLISRNGTAASATAISNMLTNYDGAIFFVEDAADLRVAQLVSTRSAQNKKVAIISTFVQGDTKTLSNFKNSLMIYGDTPEACKAAFFALSGKYRPKGILPYPTKKDE